MNLVKIYLKSILTPVIVGGIVGVIISWAMDYTSLIKPFGAPPSILFPIVWTVLYILMGISYGILKSEGKNNKKIQIIYYTQLLVNSLWSIIFFTLKWRLFAFIWIIILIILVIIMIFEFYRKNKISGLLQIPYLLWIIFASYLNIAIYILNR